LLPDPGDDVFVDQDVGAADLDGGQAALPNALADRLSRGVEQPGGAIERQSLRHISHTL
jgi:hypothetical protein